MSHCEALRSMLLLAHRIGHMQLALKGLLQPVIAGSIYRLDCPQNDCRLCLLKPAACTHWQLNAHVLCACRCGSNLTTATCARRSGQHPDRGAILWIPAASKKAQEHASAQGIKALRHSLASRRSCGLLPAASTLQPRLHLFHRRSAQRSEDRQPGTASLYVLYVTSEFPQIHSCLLARESQHCQFGILCTLSSLRFPQIHSSFLTRES